MCWAVFDLIPLRLTRRGWTGFPLKSPLKRRWRLKKPRENRNQKYQSNRPVQNGSEKIPVCESRIRAESERKNANDLEKMDIALFKPIAPKIRNNQSRR
jgi:hypothetical protein